MISFSLTAYSVLGVVQTASMSAGAGGEKYFRGFWFWILVGLISFGITVLAFSKTTKDRKGPKLSVDPTLQLRNSLLVIAFFWTALMFLSSSNFSMEGQDLGAWMVTLFTGCFPWLMAFGANYIFARSSPRHAHVFLAAMLVIWTLLTIKNMVIWDGSLGDLDQTTVTGLLIFLSFPLAMNVVCWWLLRKPMNQTDDSHS